MTDPPAAPPRRGPLRPIELATAAVMSGVALVAVLLGSVIPYAGSLQLLAVVPFGVVAQRHRPRAVVAALAAGVLLSALLSGVGAALTLLACGLLGALVGDLKRRGRGFGSVLLAAAVIGPASAGLADLVLLVFGSYRHLVIRAMQSTVDGTARTMERVPALRGPAHGLSDSVRTLLDNWAWTVAATMLITVIGVLIFTWFVLGAVLDRLRWIADPPAVPVEAPDGAAPAPLPVTLTDVAVRYPGASTDALTGVSLRLVPGQFVVLLGANGSGKSTLARVLAGLPPQTGTVTRPGRAGLGEPGGTALIGQRPDAQVLGARVADDLVWGLPADAEVDVDGLLACVGLAGLAEQETSTLSGGQLQRLAVAAALARRPALLISDEATAMVDPTGRTELVGMLRDLARTHGLTVVHVTHNDDETVSADRVIRLAHGRLAEVADPVPMPRRATVAPAGPAPAALVLEHVSHYYAYGTPWQHQALDDISLTVTRGEGVLVVGDNGSGKSTLAWIMAGLLRPSSGRCLVDGTDAHRRRGSTGLAFQHARLQVLRPTVASDIAHAAGRPAQQPYETTAALAAVGLNPELADRPVDRLSGGQLRRVALAGLLARQPGVLVLDEPLAGLDAAARTELVDTLAMLRERTGVALIVVSHDPHHLAELCPRTLHLERGRLLADSRSPEPVR